MSSIWNSIKIIAVFIISIKILWSIWGWVITSEQRKIEQRLLSMPEVEAVQQTYYEGSALDLHVWTKSGGYIKGLGISSDDLYGEGQATIAQIGNLNVSCANKENVSSGPKGEVFASLFEIGAATYNNPKLSFIELVDNYDDVQSKIRTFPNSFSDSETYSISSDQFFEIYPNATRYEGYDSFEFLCKVTDSSPIIVPLKPGAKIRSPKVWFNRKND